MLTLLEPATRAEYLALVAPIAEKLESLLSDRVVANRLARCSSDPPELRLRAWRFERRAFAHRLRAIAARRSTIAIADVRRCYASVSPSTVERALEDRGIGSARAIARFLARLERAGGRGLPVGPEASAVLANAVLAVADEALLGRGVEHLRWVDDFVFAADDPERAATAIGVLAEVLAGLGLRLNAAKTRIVATGGGVDLLASQRALGAGG